MFAPHARSRFRTLPILLAAGIAAVAPPASPAPAAPAPAGGADDAEDTVDPRWLDRLDQLDRELLDANLGYAPPAFTDDLAWPDGEPLTWDELRGKIVVIQSWTSGSAAGQRLLLRAIRTLDDHPAEDVQIIALHTPENAGNAAVFLERKPIEGARVIVDAEGRFCDELGAYKRPVNLVIDRNGTVRYAGLNRPGLGRAVEELIAEKADSDATPTPRPEDAPEPDRNADASFPTITGGVGSATDIRGKRAPDLHVEQWINARPELTSGKVVLIDFWATWCGPCVASIPHMNELAARFRDHVVCIGISSESADDFTRGLKRRNLPLNNFKYHLALDPARRMSSAIKVRGIPHCIVMSSDWVVRWQGHPARLDAATVEQIVQADAAANGAAGAAGSRRYRWTDG